MRKPKGLRGAEPSDDTESYLASRCPEDVVPCLPVSCVRLGFVTQLGARLSGLLDAQGCLIKPHVLLFFFFCRCFCCALSIVCVHVILYHIVPISFDISNGFMLCKRFSIAPL